MTHHCVGVLEDLEVDAPNHEIGLGTLVEWGCGEKLRRVVVRAKGCSAFPPSGSTTTTSKGKVNPKLERVFKSLRVLELEDVSGQVGRGRDGRRRKKVYTPWEALGEAKVWLSSVRCVPVSEGFLSYLTEHPGSLESLTLTAIYDSYSYSLYHSEEDEEEEEGGANDLARKFWSSVLPRFKRSLKKLVVETQFECGWRLRNGEVEEYLSGFERLEYLEIPVHTEAGVLLDEEGGSVFIRTMLDLVTSYPSPLSTLHLQYKPRRSYYSYVEKAQKQREVKAKEALEKGLERYSWKAEPSASGRGFEPLLRQRVA
ncbi:hypothetical protein CC2G_004196 [Coprinopsis cinerea AmutBmut pab1-1]|nr:hypothetical protein CC2G_004196 [Coprinopsis cinerea AmutBmut pab1-1]